MPKKTDNYILFLNNKYNKADNDFYLKAMKGCATVAVDGGVRFFIKNKSVPDFLLGDFDSAPQIPKWLSGKTTIITHPVHKDKTDSQLAIEYAINSGCKEITICGAASIDEIDHTLGNVFLLEHIDSLLRKKNRQMNACLINPNWTIYFAQDKSITLNGKKGDYLSILPLSNNCHISYSGLAYPAPTKNLKIGDSLSLRNRFTGKSAKINIRGKALIIKVDNK